MAFVFDDIIDGILKIANKFIPDPAQQEQMALELAQLKAAQDTAELQADTAVAVEQNKVNEVQAASSDKFTSRMRPMGGYLCMTVIGYQGIVQPFVVTIAKIFHNDVVMPVIDGSLLAICGAVWTGLNGMRSLEKIKGVTTSWVDPDSQ